MWAAPFHRLGSQTNSAEKSALFSLCFLSVAFGLRLPDTVNYALKL